MAKSGQFISSKYSGAYSMIFDWTVASQDAASNSSTINWSLTFKANGSDGASSSSQGTYNIYVDENLYTRTVAGGWSISGGGSKVLATGSTVVYHQSTDAQSFTFSFDATPYIKVNSVNSVNFSWEIGVQTGVIDAIVLNATLVSVTPDSPTDEDTLTINYLNPCGSSTKSLTVYALFSDGTTALASRSLTKTATSYSLSFTTADKNKLYAKLNAGYTEVALRFYITSTVPYNGSTKTVTNGPITKTLKFINYLPTLSPTAVEGNSDVHNLTGDSNTMVAGMSNAVFTTGAAAYKNATIVKQYISNGDQQIDNVSSGTLYGVTSNTFYFYAEDSRGNIVRDFKVVNFIPYVKPTCKVKTDNIEAEGGLNIYLSGKYFGGSFGAVANKLYVDYKIYVNGTDVPSYWSTRTLTPTVDETNNYTATFRLTGLDYNKRYNFVIRVYDELNTSEETSGVVAAEPLFDWNKEDFCFYIPVEMQDGFKYPQNLLWSGVEQMGNGTTITLSAPVSEQPTGIVLVFSLYRDTVEDASIHSFFISRKQIELLGGKPHMFMMGINSNLSVFGSKYIYIRDNELSGFSGNSSASTAACGITFDNTKFVLRYVIGV